jgi:hypothetical protein
MKMWQVTRRMRQIHNVLALVVGTQVLLWMVSGLYFTLYPIETVRGSHLRAPVEQVLTPPAEGWVPAGPLAEGARAVMLKPWLGRAVYVVEHEAGTQMFDAATGDQLTPLDEVTARSVAEANWGGQGTLTSAMLVEAAPSESGRKGDPMWRIEFEGKDTATFWVTPDTGEVRAVRTGVWRLFDLMWGLHIMDWSARETIASWWMKAFAFGGLMMSLAGAWLLVRRLTMGTLLR